MAKNISQILRKKKPKYFLYLSSDSVYADSKNKLSENSELKPESMHGIMHLMREEILCLAGFGPQFNSDPAMLTFLQ